MNENYNLPPSISHKKLSLLMLKAKKENLSSNDSVISENKELDEFLNSLDEFEKASKEIIKTIANKNKSLFKTKSSNSIMAIGAMEAHLNMALQAVHLFKNDRD
tara:strand:+ start:937 stop:1248 length:312 start_codon:yes stop_codon:yes gene_type:complete